MNPKNLSRSFRIALLSAVLCSSAALAEDATASATVVTALSIAKDTNADLKFGEVGSQAGTIILLKDGTIDGASTGQTGNSNGRQAASFTVTGDAAATYVVTLPASLTISDDATPANTMTVNGFSAGVVDGSTFDSSTRVGTLSGTTGTGTQTIKVGATLNVGASQAAGTYSGTFSVTVAYN